MALNISDISILEEPTDMLVKISTINRINRKLITKVISFCN